MRYSMKIIIYYTIELFLTYKIVLLVLIDYRS